MTELMSHDLTELTDTFRLLGEPNRLVLACVDKATRVGDLSDELAISQTLAS